MKKVYCLMAFAIFSVSAGFAQSSAEKENKYVFESQAQKEKKMAAVQEVIDANKDNPKADLKMYYAELELIKNGIVRKESNAIKNEE